ncbi:MAG: hypothetical protein JRG76_02810 [Deltaproteobacteria bacterium]|nr:hypothetical protein [Deltaproteobacteria bacterium]MBW2413420.1 hypothetical protein [Deltaproteobacteria bacterium]
MRRIVYSHWDGKQQRYSLEADQALDELSRFLMEGLDLQESLDWMRYQGFDLAGMDFRVMGLEEMLQELRQQARELMSGYNMDQTFDERWQQLEDILGREETAQERDHGVESAAYNDFRRRRDDLPRRLSQALESFRDHEWADAEAEADFQELLGDQQDASELEDFYARNRGQLQGGEGLGFEEALELMRQVEAISQMAQNLLDGNFESISMDQLREMLGEEGAQSIMILRDLEGALERGGYLREGADGPELTPRAIRRLGELALEDIYASLKRGGAGTHETKHRGGGVVAPERTRPYVFGEPSHLDTVGTLRNALRRGLPEPDAGTGRTRLDLEPGDLEVFDTDQLTETTTVLLLDMSWSMSWSGRWPAAKRVAVAMDHLIRTRYPRDRFFIVGFYTRARELRIHELPELSWNMTDPFTNLQDGLRIAQRLIDRNPSPNSQIIVITDGQPTAYFLGEELRVEWPNGYGGISPRANRETLREVRRVTRRGITINTFMLDDAPELVRFVEAMTRINKGRAFYTTPQQIGEYVMVDYLTRKKRRIG